MSDFDKTPSFYNSQDTFEKYLGQTSYYLALQDAVTDIVGFSEVSNVLELGSGTGETSVRLAETYPDCHVQALDMRETVITPAQARNEQSNLEFEVGDMRSYVHEVESLPSMVVMLYSFHHIPDPREQKVKFLETCYEALPEGGRLCIAEGFVSENANSTVVDGAIRSLWAKRGIEAYASTFWAALDSLSTSDIERAKAVGNFSESHELKAGENVVNRDDEYLVSMGWLVGVAESIGYKIVLSEPVNALGEGIVLLEKR